MPFLMAADGEPSPCPGPRTFSGFIVVRKRRIVGSVRYVLDVLTTRAIVRRFADIFLLVEGAGFCHGSLQPRWRSHEEDLPADAASDSGLRDCSCPEQSIRPRSMGGHLEARPQSIAVTQPCSAGANRASRIGQS